MAQTNHALFLRIMERNYPPLPVADVDPAPNTVVTYLWRGERYTGRVASVGYDEFLDEKRYYIDHPSEHVVLSPRLLIGVVANRVAA